MRQYSFFRPGTAISIVYFSTSSLTFTAGAVEFIFGIQLVSKKSSKKFDIRFTSLFLRASNIINTSCFWVLVWLNISLKFLGPCVPWRFTLSYGTPRAKLPPLPHFCQNSHAQAAILARLRMFLSRFMLLPYLIIKRYVRPVVCVSTVNTVLPCSGCTAKIPSSSGELDGSGPAGTGFSALVGTIINSSYCL